MGDTASEESGEGEALTRKGGEEQLLPQLIVGMRGPSQGGAPGWKGGVALKLSEREDLMSIPLGVAKPGSE